MADDGVRQVLPPPALLRVLNPVLRTVLSTPLGRGLPALAVLEFRGRRTGRRFRVVSGWHELDGEHFAVTPSSWRANFVGGAPLTVRHRGRARAGTGVLDRDPASVARAVAGLIAAGTPPRSMALQVPPGHVFDERDAVATDKALVRFRTQGVRT